MINDFYVYGLKDPRNNELFYIGKGRNNRLKEHVYRLSNNNPVTHKECKIYEILQSGLKVIEIKLYENLQENEALQIERDLIIKYGRKYIDENGILLNIVLDGIYYGMSGKQHTAQTKEKISTSKKGTVAWNKNKLMPTEIKLNMSLAQKKRFLENPVTEETRNKMSSATANRVVTEEFRQTMRNSWILRKANKQINDN